MSTSSLELATCLSLPIVNAETFRTGALAVLLISVIAVATGCASDPDAIQLMVPEDCQRQVAENKDPAVPYQSAYPSFDCLQRIERQNSGLQRR